MSPLAGRDPGRTSVTALLLASLLLGAAPAPARADNPMGYRLLSDREAAGLAPRHGSLGLDAERASRITDRDMTFDIIRVTQVRAGSPAARAGLRRGDQIIALDGRVFASLASFAGYVGSLPPGATTAIDYIPRGGGPGQAQRVPVTIGEQGRAGLSTGAKVAIGVGAAALLGCYEMGCFSHRSTAPATVP